MLALKTPDIKAILFFTGMIILSLIFYKLADHFKPHRSWAQSAAGSSMLIYSVLGSMYGGLWPVLGGLITAFILYYPLRLLYIIILDSIQKNDYDVFNMEDEDFRKLEVDTQLSLLSMRIKYYRKAIIRLQTGRGLAFMAFITSSIILVLGLLVLSKLEYRDILLLLANIILFILLVNVTPRTGGIFYNFLKKYVFNFEIIELKDHYEQQLQQSNYEIKAIEQGYYMATKQQIMNRLKF